MLTYYLQITSSLFLLSYIYYLLYSKKNNHEIALSFCLLFVFSFSQLFWNDPKKYSLIHKTDAYIAKFSICCFVLYTIFYKNLESFYLYSYLFLMFLVFYFFYLSNYYSSKDWCCPSHIFYHGASHIFCFIGSLYAFI